MVMALASFSYSHVMITCPTESVHQNTHKVTKGSLVAGAVHSDKRDQNIISLEKNSKLLKAVLKLTVASAAYQEQQR